MIIYTVTVFKRYDEDRRKENRQRTWGFYAKFEHAERSILENWTDMFEHGYYDIACVEEVPEGVCQLSTVKQWYSALYYPQPAPGFYPPPVITKIDTPEWAQRSCNWSMS